MIKMSHFGNEDSTETQLLHDIIRYARENELFVWQVQTETDAQFTRHNQPTQRVVHAWLVNRLELGHLLHEQNIDDDTIPF